MRVAAGLYRGGTSRGLIFSASDLAMYSQRAREYIICSAMGSPDPDQRQIDGVGGGVSSLSKAAVVSVPSRDRHMVRLSKMGEEWAFPGVPWADDVARACDAETGYDAVYRFGQVPVSGGTGIDWSATCGNMMSAVAIHTYMKYWRHFRPFLLHVDPGASFTKLPMRILMANSDERVTVHVPLEKRGENAWFLSSKADTHIAGVPGLAPGILVETPLPSSPWPTGRPLDTLRLGDQDIRVSIVQAGLPTVFVHAADLGVSSDQIVQPAHVLDTDTQLHERIEALRYQAAQCAPDLQRQWSMSAPKVCLVHPRTAYTTSGGTHVPANAMDILVRAVSVGNFHRSIMATALSALAVASTCPDTVVYEAYAAGGSMPCASSKDRASPLLHAFTVGQPAGTARSMVRMSKEDPTRTPTAVVMERTARRIMHGFVDVPPHELLRSKGTYFGLPSNRKH